MSECFRGVGAPPIGGRDLGEDLRHRDEDPSVAAVAHDDPALTAREQALAETGEDGREVREIRSDHLRNPAVPEIFPSIAKLLEHLIQRL